MERKARRAKNPSTSSLSESWNIVDGNDVNISEGSDGESIEVIEEESNQVVDNSPTINTEDKNESKEEFFFTKSDNEIKVTTASFNSEINDLQDSEINSVKENDAGISNAVESYLSDGLNPYSILGLIAVLCAILFAGATFWVLLLRMEEIALDTFHYLIPSRSQGSSNSKDLNDLVNQIKAYEVETANLRILVSDLTGAVENLKKELAVSLKFADKGPYVKAENKQLKDEDILHKELLKTHFPKKEDSDIIQGKVNSSYEDIAKYVQELISNLTSRQEHEINVESIKLFYQIPKFLKVLDSFNDVGEDIDLFITSWKIRLNIANEKIMEDIRSMQFKMMRNLMNQIRNTQRKFYNKLCNLSVMKKKECFETFVSPYSHERTFSEDKANNALFGETVDHGGKSPPDSNDNFIERDLKEVVLQTVIKDNIDNKPGNQKENKEEINKIHPDILNKKKSITEDDYSSSEKKPIKDKINKQKNNLNDKGMENNLNTDPGTYDQINVFSSFSQDQGDDRDSRKERNSEYGKDKVWENQKGPMQEEHSELDDDDDDDEGTWFLEIGTQRSKLRDKQDRTDWFFDRARYRNSRKT